MCRDSNILLTDVGIFFPWRQVWFRVNEQLPVGLQKSLPDRPPEMQSAVANEGKDNFLWVHLSCTTLHVNIVFFP